MFARRLATAALMGAGMMVLAACQPGSIDDLMGSEAPLPAALVKDMRAKGMGQHSPMLVRLFKEESELEVWKQTDSGTYALLKTYPICAWSGKLGPKRAEGDRQAPEGFYNITIYLSRSTTWRACSRTCSNGGNCVWRFSTAWMTCQPNCVSTGSCV